MWRPHGKSVAYAATSLAAAFMNPVFSFFYVKVYLNHFHVDEKWFHLSQILYMVWNAINDPLFGYVQDNLNYSWVRSRRHSILYGAPFFCISFLVTWFPWGNYEQPSWLCGLQLMFALCLYDTLFTFVLLAQCALFAELSTDQDDRLRLVRYSQVASLIGANSIFFCSYMSDNLKNFQYFQGCCVVLAILAYFAMRYTGMHATTEYDDVQRQDETSKTEENQLKTVWRQTIQIFKHRSFISFVLMNFLQIYHTNFLSNFTSIICERLVSDDILPSTQRSFYFGLVSLLSQILVIVGTPVVGSCGYFSVIRFSFFIKIVLGGLLYAVGPSPSFVLLFLLIDSGFGNATFSLFNLPLSDIIDEDMRINKRQHPLSSMVFGTNALITKPAISFAPMITVAILNMYGYDEVRNSKDGVHVQSPALDHSMFVLMAGTSVTIGLLQLIVWSLYDIRKTRSVVVKHVES